MLEVGPGSISSMCLLEPLEENARIFTEQKEKTFSPLVLVLGEPSGTTRLEEYRV